MPPLANFSISSALSSPLVFSLWTRQAPQAITSTSGSCCPRQWRAAWRACPPRSLMAPPPVFSMAQKCGPCGPLCDSRERTQSTRESHSGPHSPHFWDIEKTGGGAMNDLACHCVEAARYFYGKEDQVVEAMAWGANLVHHKKTKGEDNALLVLKFSSVGSCYPPPCSTG